MLGGINPLMMAAAKIYVTETVQSLPAMTSDTAPTGHVASASSTNSGSIYWAFDQNMGTGQWVAGSGDAWVRRQTPSPIRVAKIKVYSSVAANGYQISFEASNDGTSFVTLISSTTLSSNGQEFTVPSGSRGHYLYHRLVGIAWPLFVRVTELEILQDL